ncbi:DNA-binding response regulator [Putridiphycobacter roseus]|uniref:DNA-binding response regulator n=1 Tax=Putridiphycobacter roseus TaxID=2219161 RepID=A0A2W1N2N9_9FLAO|nr:response regulator transcription factor [Putridiphycobacter roseus]PZE18124.1 DNA-binding response regulator [Putridiphycobacter roseus]
MKLLLIEDENDLSTIIANYFKKMGELVIIAQNKFEAEDRLVSHQFDVIILDITLPDGNGIDILPTIKKTQENAGILILSAKNSLDDKIKGLDLGADDYLTKPFHLAELNSRIKALVRRKIFKGADVIHFNEINISLTEKQAYINRELLVLTKKEFMLLLYFINNTNRILTKESIAEHLWGEDLDFIENYDFIYTHIKNLRKKILAMGGTDYLNTVHGIGYKYCNV